MHHIIAGGIEHGKIFRDDNARDAFVTRLGRLTISLHLGYFYRSHHDIDLLIINLHQLAEEFKASSTMC